MTHAVTMARRGDKKRIGILQTDHTPSELIAKHGDYNDFFIRSLADEKLDFDTYAVVDGVFPTRITDADGWLVTGAKYAAYEQHDWISKLERLIREIYDARMPMVGVCFGHEIIAQALGGRVEKAKRGWTVGPIDYERSDLKRTQTIIAWHQDQVTVRPPPAELIGSSADCENAVLRYGLTVLTYQGHPEITPAYLRDLLQLQGQHLSETDRQNVLGTADACLSTADIILEIKELFLRAHQMMSPQVDGR